MTVSGLLSCCTLSDCFPLVVSSLNEPSPVLNTKLETPSEAVEDLCLELLECFSLFQKLMNCFWGFLPGVNTEGAVSTDSVFNFS